MRKLLAGLLTGALSTLLVTADAAAQAPTPPPQQLLNEPYLYEVVSHLYRWYMDEIDIVRGTRDKDTFVFWVRGLNPELDPGDNSRLGEIVLPVLGISVKVKKADYTIEKLNAVVKSETFKIINVARVPMADEAPAGFREVKVNRADMRAYLFKARNQARFPDDELMMRIRMAARRQLGDDLLARGEKRPEDEAVIHIAPLSPVANETWVFWEEGRVLIRFASDIDLDNPAVWEHEDLAAKMYDLDDQVVVSLDEVAGSNAYLTRDQVGRALYNCVILGRRLVLDPKDVPEE